MKTIYIDVLITVNVFVDFILIVCSKKLLHIRAPLGRMILGSIIGGIISLIALLPRMPAAVTFAADIIFAAIIIFVSFGKTDLKSFLKRVAVYFSLSFSFCGAMIFIYTAFKPNGMEIYNDVVYFNISPILLIILTLVCYYILRLIRMLTKGIIGKNLCNLEISHKGKTALLSALIDTGCNVKEPFSGEYVIITEKSAINELLPAKSQRIIPFNSMGGSGVLIGFKPERVKIDGKEVLNNVYIGVSENILKGETKAIIPFEIIKNI